MDKAGVSVLLKSFIYIQRTIRTDLRRFLMRIWALTVCSAGVRTSQMFDQWLSLSIQE